MDGGRVGEMPVMRKFTLLTLSAAALLLACAGKRLDVGSDQGTVATGGRSGGAGGARATGGEAVGGSMPRACVVPAEYTFPDPADCLPMPDSPLVGVWRGHWPDPIQNSSEEAELTIAGLTADGTPCGTFKIGQGPELPPATDAAASYPPGAIYGAGGNGPLTVARNYHPGHAYPLMRVESEPKRLAFAIPLFEIFRSWCELQTQFEDTNTCFDPSGYQGDGSGCYQHDRSVSCAQITLCGGGVCRCENGCCFAQAAQGASVELHWDDGALEGTVATFSGPAQIYLDPVPKP